ncbi:hypothetical protein JCGZ_22696 [Jatropha curcas]|uniref:Uncharacterized protein n=1 Tax=Jatropha curcas TaxID=180498 RepID=A0A067K3A0_JATCU|nr:hypothetical protein JCGZ_22696 [Jatropha curcas]
MYYLGEKVYEWKLSPDRRRVPHDVPYYMVSTRSIQLEQDIAAAWRGSAATNHLAAFASRRLRDICTDLAPDSCLSSD